MAVTGDASLQKEYIDEAVKAVAGKEFRIYTLCTQDSSNAQTETYFREDNTELTGGTGSAIKQTPRFAAFPNVQPSWTKVTTRNEKYAAEFIISLEDEIMTNIPKLARGIVKTGRAVANAMNLAVEAVLSASAGNTYAVPAGYEIDSATIQNRDPINIALQAIQLIRADNIDPLNGQGYWVMNGTDFTNIISNSKVTNNFSFKAADVVSNGKVAQLVGLTLMIDESVTADQSYIVVKNEGLVWKSVKGITTEIITDAGISKTVRVYAIGHCQLQAPNCICKITNMRA